MKTHEFTVNLNIRGRDVIARGTWTHGDHTVGIFGIEANYQVFDLNGNVLDWELDDAEYDFLCNQIDESIDCMVGDYLPGDEDIDEHLY